MFDLQDIRTRFPALARLQAGEPVVYFDGPAGSQVPQAVIDAVSDSLARHNANCGGPFATSRESDEILTAARLAATDFLQVRDSDEIVFGPNMTSLTMSLSRALAETWNAGDEVIVSRLDHDANVTPWVLAAERRGVIVRQIDVRPEDCTLNQEHYRSLLNERTRLVAVGLASNATGTINPVREMIAAARSAGARTFVDAVHSAPHRRIHAAELGCDFLVCSGYKFFGPHVALLWGRKELLTALRPDKLRPAPQAPPGKWMTGTQNHEGIAGMKAAIDYLADLSGSGQEIPRRERLDRAFAGIQAHESALAERFLQGLANLPQYRLWGIGSRERLAQRVPTFSLTHSAKTPQELAGLLGAQGIFCWGGNHYALPFTQAMGLEPGGTLRVGFLHYNSLQEVDRLLQCLANW